MGHLYWWRISSCGRGLSDDDELVFDDLLDTKWERSIAKLGIDLSLLSGDAGHA